MRNDTSVLRRVCLWISWLAFGLATCPLGFLGYLFLTEQDGINSIAGGIAIAVLGILTVGLLFIAFSFGLTARGSVIGRAGLFILSIIVISALIEFTGMNFLLLGPLAFRGSHSPSSSSPTAASRT